MANPSRLLPAALALAFLAGVAEAAIVLRVTVEDLTDKATVVVEGEVLGSKAAWTADRSTIRTTVRISVKEVLKGSAEGELRVICFGGRVGEDEVRVGGVPKFEKGERVVVFLWRNGRGDLIPLGMSQGKFRIAVDPETGELMARNSLEGLAFAYSGKGKKEAERLKRPDVMKLSELERRVRERLAAKKPPAAEEKPAEPEDGAKPTPESEKPDPEAGKDAPRPAGEEGDGDVVPAPKKDEPAPKKEERPGEETPRADGDSR